MIKIAIVGLGKMGLSHLAIVNAHPDVELAAVCDSSGYLLDILKKYTGVTTYTDYRGDAARASSSTRSSSRRRRASHAAMVRAALDRGLHVFCEKPLLLDVDGWRGSSAALARERGW